MVLQWETDRALQARRALALVLVVVLPVAFVLLMNTVGVELLTFATEREWRGRFYVEPWLVVGAVAVGFAAQYFLGERSALRAVGARRVDPDAHDALSRLSGFVGVETPALADRGVCHVSTDGTVRSFSTGGRERWAHDLRGRIRSRVAAAGGRAYVLAGESLVAAGPEGTAWRVPLDGREEPFTPEFGPFAVGRTLVLGGSGEVRGYWRSQLR